MMNNKHQDAWGKQMIQSQGFVCVCGLMLYLYMYIVRPYTCIYKNIFII